jgi:hypothetical protein
MVERFERNKLYVNSNVPNRIVKCEFLTSRGAAVLTHVCKNPGFVETDGRFNRGTDEIISSSPENWDEFELPHTPGLTQYVISYISTTGQRRCMSPDFWATEQAAVEYTRRTSITDVKRDALAYMIHPIIITQRQTLEQFVRSVEDNEETI